MAAGNTYTQIASTTLGSAAASVTFSSIPATYTDLVLVATPLAATGGVGTLYTEFNGDTAANYSTTILKGNGTSATSNRLTGSYGIDLGGNDGVPTTQQNFIASFNNYSNATTYKTVLTRYNNSAAEVDAMVGLWRNTAAINSIKIYIGFANTATPQDNLNTGSTFNLYGITAA